jgi:hypothetical protein
MACLGYLQCLEELIDCLHLTEWNITAGTAGRFTVTLAAGTHSPRLLSKKGGKLPTVTFRLSVKGNKDSSAQGVIQVDSIQATRSATIKHASCKESQDNMTVNNQGTVQASSYRHD